MITPKRVLVCGRGRSGKDTFCEHLSKVTGLRNAGTTSKYLAPFVAAKLGIPVEEAYACRHESDEMRVLWHNTGDEVRQNGPTTLIKMALAHGEITGGVRDCAEVETAREEKLFDLIVWVENHRAPFDHTMRFGSKACDVVVENHWGLDEFHRRIERLAEFAGLMGGRKVYVVLHDNYADQGVDYHGVFESKEEANEYVREHSSKYNDLPYWDIEEETV